MTLHWTDDHQALITHSPIAFSSIQYYEDIYLPGNSATGPEQWSVSYQNASNLQTVPGPYNSAWSFSMVPELLCLPLEEM